ncbi:MAG: outer membrane beta-barrel protein [Rickettsiales bacterium]|nr:outer membrane beta-barrel protein [Rickettsiales bacterium]
MNKITSALLLIGLTISAADAAPSYIRRAGAQGYKVTYDYTNKEKSGWYASVRAQLNLLNWKNIYYSDDVGRDGHDDYSFEPVFGGGVSAGKKFSHFWRAELEVGYTGQFTDSGQGFEFNFSTPYALLNAYYDFTNGLYLGAGAGAAMPLTTWNSDIFLSGNRTKAAFSPMAGLMLGYARELDDNFVLDLRYRIAGWNGSKHTRYFTDNAMNPHYFETKIDLVLENSFSVGLRYEF